MHLGQRIKNARLEAGMSQRQLCGETITRNMLSQIENGSARPSMDTLRYPAARLGKSVSYFLEENAVTSPNQAVMAVARQHFAAGDWAGVAATLEDYHTPDDTFDWEMDLLRQLSVHRMAEAAIARGELSAARQLLAAQGESPYTACTEFQHRLLLYRADPDAAPPELDSILLLKADRAMAAAQYDRAQAFLTAADDHTDPQWQLLQGRLFFAREQYRQAAEQLIQAESAFPAQAYPLLEQCYLKLEDYKMAYLYACKQR